ncbi:hypothetical protein [Streptomyces atratus]|uniref:hypothetical protein n=1 Tax=Streptomyces atratus TaxID=1893 RepID=UPI0016717F98
MVDEVAVTGEAGAMGLLLHGHDPDFRNELVGVIECGFAEADNCVSVAEICPDLGLVDERVPDEVRVTGPHRDLLGDAAPEGCAVHVSGVLVQPPDERRVGRTDPQETAAGLALRGADQFVDELVLRGHGADQVVWAEEHVGPVVALQLLLEVVDQGGVNVLRRDRSPSGEITRTNCRRCGKEVHGIDGRYSCPLCGWVNHWSEGHTTLPTGRDDNH